jgi:hypothetical protein
MLDREYVRSEMKKLTDIREEFYRYLDENISKTGDDSFDFTDDPMLDAKRVYEHFFKLDYQARKLRGFLIEAYEFNV